MSFRTGQDILEGRDIHCPYWEKNPESPNAQSSHYTDHVNAGDGKLMKDVGKEQRGSCRDPMKLVSLIFPGRTITNHRKSDPRAPMSWSRYGFFPLSVSGVTSTPVGRVTPICSGLPNL